MVRPLPTSLFHRSNDGVVDVDGGSNPGIFESLLRPPMPALEVSEALITRRFYLEIVALRQHQAVTAADLLADPRLAPAFASIEDAAAGAPVRIACLVELEDAIDLDALQRARDVLARYEIALDVWPQLADASQ